MKVVRSLKLPPHLPSIEEFEDEIVDLFQTSLLPRQAILVDLQLMYIEETITCM